MEEDKHSDKRMKTKHIPITLISTDNKHDHQYFHKKPHHDEIKETKATNTDNNESSSGDIVITAIGDKGETVPLHITKVEQHIFKTLLEVVEQTKCNTTLRVAGGWVRDKLRGDDSSDIDIALDNMMGEAFATLVNQYLKDNKQETHRIGVIQSNPEQSKHLETATVRIFDMWIDFVNLRSETYSEHSRIPEIKIGTAKDDAYRRDLTINSLFYNINENRIEDFTGNGIEDLKCGIVRTPLPPLTTFNDDPLRVLRSIRFATRLYYSIDHKLVEAASCSTVKEALRTKVSHERVGIELDGMLNGPRPDLAIHLINHFGLFDHIFSLPEGIVLKEKDYQFTATENILNMMRFINWGTIGEEVPTRKIRLLSSLLQVFHKYTYKTKKNRDVPTIHYILVEFLKFSNKDCDDVLNTLDCAEKLKEHVHKLSDTGAFSRKDVGLIIHKAGPLWRAALANSLISEIPKYKKTIVYPFQLLENPDGSPTPRSPMHDFHHHSHNPHAHHPPLCEESKQTVIKYDNFCASVASHNLIGIWNIKKLLNGKQVMDLLKKKPGEWLAPVLQEVFEWQLENPNGTEDQCKQWILNKYTN